jgi:hypothetical protein
MRAGDLEGPSAIRGALCAVVALDWPPRLGAVDACGQWCNSFWLAPAPLTRAASGLPRQADMHSIHLRTSRLEAAAAEFEEAEHLFPQYQVSVLEGKSVCGEREWRV